MVRFSVDDEAIELLSSLLWDAGTTGIVEVDGVLLAGFDDRASADAVARRAARWPATVLAVEPNRWAGTDEMTTVVIGPTDGGDRGRASIEPRTLSIVAGPTFGHGGHPTTALALDLLTSAVADRGPTPAGGRTGLRVLDVGTGSGVLAIAAAAIGVGPVVGVDIDADAVAVARDNAARNGVEVVITDDTVDGAADLVEGRRFDIVMANLLLPVHRRLASSIAGVVAPAATLVTAGYLIADGPELVGCYRHAFGGAGRGPVTVAAEERRGGWLGHRFDLGSDR